MGRWVQWSAATLRHAAWAWALAGCAVTATGTTTHGTDAGTDLGSLISDVATEISIIDAARLCTQPQLLFPETRTILSAPRPRFGWRGVSGEPMYRVRICRDRGCNDIIADERVSGTRWSPTVDLAAGIYFWSVSRMDRSECPGQQTRQLRVRSRPNPVTAERDVVFSDSADVDGDGLADLVISREDGAIDVIRGDRALSMQMTRLRFQPPVEHLSSLGYNQLTTADVDGDGIQDIVHTTVDPRRWPAESAAIIEVVFGTADISAPHEVVRMAEIRSVGAIVESYRGRDLDQDGAEDILVWASVPRSNADSRVYVLWGARDRRAFSSSSLAGEPPEDLVFGASLTSLDEDADGATDVFLTGARGPVILRGPLTTRSIPRPTPLAMAPALARARGTECDFDGDGVVDPIIRSPQRIHLVLISSDRQSSSRNLPVEPVVGNAAPCCMRGYQNRLDEVLDAPPPRPTRSIRRVSMTSGSVTAADVEISMEIGLSGYFLTGDMDGDEWPEVLTDTANLELIPRSFVLATLRGGNLSALRRLEIGRNRAHWM